MAYIGREPVIGNFVKLDAISVVNGQASYTMQNGGANFTAYETVNQFLVSLNGILQSPTTSFTVSSSTITFASNLVTGDVIDFIIVLGNTLDIGTPSDNTVSLAKLTATGTKDATTFLRGDNTFSTISAGITEADQWRITADHSGVGDITANWERNDTQFSYIGSGMTESSGIFTFPSTGIYLVMGSATGSVGGGASQFVNLTLYNTINNSTYSNVAMAYSHAYTADSYFSMQVKAILDVTDTSNVKVKLGIAQNQANSVFVQGATNRNMTYMTFIRLGDT